MACGRVKVIEHMLTAGHTTVLCTRDRRRRKKTLIVPNRFVIGVLRDQLHAVGRMLFAVTDSEWIGLWSQASQE